MITLDRSVLGPVIVNDATGERVHIEIDYDYPAVAETFGWWIGSVIRCHICGEDTASSGSMRGYVHKWGPVSHGDYVPCEHDGTDGTIDCDACGTTASEFIAAARDYLDEHIGESATDPGYFE